MWADFLGYVGCFLLAFMAVVFGYEILYLFGFFR